MTLHLHAFQPALSRLMRLAAREHLLPPGDDPGYAIHAVLAATFGALAPKPWVLLPPGQGGGPSGRLLAYTSTPLDALREHAATFGDPTFSAPLCLDDAETREMRTRFSEGTRLGFRVRVRPIARTGRPVEGHPSVVERGARGRERDVFLARVAAAERVVSAVGVPASGQSDSMTASDAPPLSRAACYVEWLDARLRDAGASIVCRIPHGSASDALAARVDAFRFTRLLVRDRGGPRARPQHLEGPDATITGTLVVDDAERFADGLARGVGRFRAFGFGMLLLTPPRV